MPKAQEMEWMSIEEALAWLRLTTRQEQKLFRKAIADGEVPALRLNKSTIRLRRSVLREKYSK